MLAMLVCELIGGLEMLVTQAAEQFRLWTGAAAPGPLLRKAAKALDTMCESPKFHEPHEV